ncbi:hypothetical protein D8Z77_17835 [Brevibacillus laterosporus]|nr:hypothetical protein D8Z77_17835 [Brevibacillus laterosporus]
MEKPMITVVFIINQLLQRSILDTPRYNKMRMIIHSHKLLRPVLFWRVSFFSDLFGGFTKFITPNEQKKN